FCSSSRRHTTFSRDWSSDVCSSDLNLARNNMGKLIAALAGRCLRTDVRRFANVVGMRARRVDADHVFQASFLHVMAKYAFGAGRAADITRANKQYLGHL